MKENEEVAEVAEVKTETKKPSGKAKKDFTIHHNEFHIVIKKGDNFDGSKIPKMFWENLKTEKVF